jgi:hypothetical protein
MEGSSWPTFAWGELKKNLGQEGWCPGRNKNWSLTECKS